MCLNEQWSPGQKDTGTAEKNGAAVTTQPHHLLPYCLGRRRVDAQVHQGGEGLTPRCSNVLSESKSPRPSSPPRPTLTSMRGHTHMQGLARCPQEQQLNPCQLGGMQER